jgi:hypothetical protein
MKNLTPPFAMECVEQQSASNGQSNAADEIVVRRSPP